MKIAKLRVNVKVEKLLVSQFFYDLMLEGDNDFVEVVDDSLTYKGYPVEVSEGAKDMEFVFDFTMEDVESEDE